MDSNTKVKQKCKELLAFTSLEVRFLVDSSSCSNATVRWWYRISSTRPRLRIAAAATRGTRTCMRITLMTVTGLALGLFVLCNSFPWMTVELRGCVVLLPPSLQSSPYRSYVPYPAIIDVCGLSKRPWIIATQKRAASSRAASSSVIWWKKYGSSFSWKFFWPPLLSQSRDNWEASFLVLQ